MLFDRGFIEFVRFPLDDPDCILVTFAEAGAQPVAQVIGGESCLAVDDSNRPFGAGGDAEAAAVAFAVIYLNYFPDHIHSVVRRFFIY
jgi:hypothetical protein